MKLTLAKEYDIVPEWNGNKASQDPCKVRCRYLNAAQKDQCFKVEYYQENNEMRHRIIPMKDILLRHAVVRVENLEINNHFVGTADHLLTEPRLAPLVAELYAEILEHESIGENELKN